MFLVQLTDLHVRPEGMAANRVAETNMLTERALRTVHNLQVQADAVIISGDLTEFGLAAEYRLLADMLRRWIRPPVYLVPGNHDRRDVMRAELGHFWGVTQHSEYVQYVVDTLPVRLVLLDTLVPGEAHGELSPQQLAWLDATLGDRPDRPTIVVMHHPPFVCGIRHMDQINLRNASEFVAVIALHKQVQRILCGHHHRPITAAVAHTIASIAPSVAHQVELDLHSPGPGFWNLEPPAFQIHAWLDGQGIVSHTAYVEHFPGPYPFLAAPDEPAAGQ